MSASCLSATTSISSFSTTPVIELQAIANHLARELAHGRGASTVDLLDDRSHRALSVAKVSSHAAIAPISDMLFDVCISVFASWHGVCGCDLVECGAETCSHDHGHLGCHSRLQCGAWLLIARQRRSASGASQCRPQSKTRPKPAQATLQKYTHLGWSSRPRRSDDLSRTTLAEFPHKHNHESQSRIQL